MEEKESPRIAGCRELLEETSQLLGASRLAPYLESTSKPNLAKSLLEQPSEDLTSKFSADALDRLIPLSRWTTPPGAPRRFDTLFYLAPFESPFSVTLADCNDKEVDAIEWLPMDELIDIDIASDTVYAKRNLAPPTVHNLALLQSMFLKCDANLEQMISRISKIEQFQRIICSQYGADLSDDFQTQLVISSQITKPDAHSPGMDRIGVANGDPLHPLQIGEPTLHRSEFLPNSVMMQTFRYRGIERFVQRWSQCDAWMQAQIKHQCQHSQQLPSKL